MNQILLNFLCRIILITGAAFSVHILILYFLDFPLFKNKILLSYTANILLAMLVFLMLFFLRKKFKNQLGVIFLIGSILKFGLFFIFFYKPYNADGVISRTEFFAFFVPYFFTHTIEIFSLSKWLNKI
tara:strand:- start:223 stop:606 length:384 start_codon:yes stop_codon:yes gene_type:complete